MSIMSIEKTIEGIKYLGIEDVSYIIDAQIANDVWEKEQEFFIQKKKEYETRLDVPIGLKKKEYELMKKETQTIINTLKDKSRRDPMNIFYKVDLEDYIEKKQKIQKMLRFPVDKNVINIQKAKQYPIEQLLEFRHGFAKRCLWHSPDKDQETPSLKWYKNSNNVYCFSCNVKKDSIDTYMKLYNCSLIQAVKALQ